MAIHLVVLRTPQNYSVRSMYVYIEENNKCLASYDRIQTNILMRWICWGICRLQGLLHSSIRLEFVEQQLRNKALVTPYLLASWMVRGSREQCNNGQLHLLSTVHGLYGTLGLFPL